jgi:hypothetical protein
MPVQPQLPDFDVFGVLGVTPDDPPEAIKAAWRERVKEHHPDAAGGSDEQIKRINVAYEWLRDPTLRETYLLATAARALRPRWDAEPLFSDDPADATENAAYEGPRAESIAALADRIVSASMDDLLDLVHRYRPERAWSLGLARVLEATGRRERGAAAVWHVRGCVRDRLEALLADDAIRAIYDDEFVGQVVSDRLADLARGIVLLDVLTADPRLRVVLEWEAVMGPTARPPGDEPGLADPTGGPSRLATRWSRIPDSARWLLGLLAAGLYATAATVLFPSREAFAVILLGFGLAAAIALRGRGSATRDR